ILAYLEDNWDDANVSPEASEIVFHEAWYDAKAGMGPEAQITVTDFVRPVGQMFTGGGTLHSRTYPRFLVNCWYREPRGYRGTANMVKIDAMRDEVLRIIQEGWRAIFAGRICIPRDEGRPLHEVLVTPRIMRYEITLMATKDL
ncbi:unnamed protein product, partial [marine sediment metagenome]